MATNTTVPAIPAPTGIERNTERVLSPIKETLDIWAGRQGNPNNRVVTVRELVDLITTDATLSVTISTVPHSHSIYLEKAGGIMTGPLELDDTLQFDGAGQTVNQIVTALSGAGTNSQLATAAAIEGLVSGHVGASDPHTGYQLESEKSAASGYASLNASGYVPPGELGSGTPDGTRYLRDDNTWQAVVSGGVTDHGALTGLGDDDHTQYQLVSAKNAASGYAGLNASGYVAPAQLGSGTPDGTRFLRDDNSWQVGGGITDHGALSGLGDDDHTQYQLVSAKNAASGYAGLNVSGYVAAGQLGSGTPDNTKFLRDDNSWQAITGGVTDHGALSGLGDDDHTQYQLVSAKNAASGYAGLNASGYVAPAQLGSGTPDGTKFLRDDNSWQAGGSGVTDHGALSGLGDDDHTQYQLVSAKGAASGYAGLNTSAYVPTANLGSGTADSTVFLRGDLTWAAAGGTGGGIFSEDATSYSIKGGTGAGTALTTTALDNFVGGRDAGRAISTGDYNIGIGYNSLRYLTTGSYNTAVGVSALRGYDSNSDVWSYNTAFGYEALYGVLDGSDYNTGVGYQAGKYVKTGDYNTYFGYQAGIMASGHTSGSSNTAIGARTMTKAYGISYCTIVGEAAGQNLYSGDKVVFVGYQAGVGHTSNSNSGVENIFIGYMVGKNYSTARNNTMIGTYSAYNTTSGSYNTAVGSAAMQYSLASGYNTCVGNNAGKGNAGGEAGTGFNYCVCVGNGAGFQLNNGTDYAICIGNQAGYYCYGGDYNTYIGYQAGYSTSSSTAAENIGVGSQALYAITSGAGNLAIGYHAGNILTTGTYNTILGYDADVDSNARTNTIVIGNGAVGTADNYVAMGNTSITAANCQVSWGTYSDRRMKNSIVDSDLGLDFIMGLRTRRFKKNDIKEDVTFDGMIAQEVKEAMEGLGVEFSGWRETGGTQSLQYEAFVMPLINAVKQLKKEIDELKGR